MPSQVVTPPKKSLYLNTYAPQVFIGTSRPDGQITVMGMSGYMAPYAGDRPSVTDIVTITDSYVNSPSLLQNQTDTLAITDSYDCGLDLALTVSDVLVLSEGTTPDIRITVSFELCDCIEIVEAIQKPVFLDVTDTLTIVDYYPTASGDTLVITDSFTINSVEDPCCGVDYVPDRKVSDVLVISDSFVMGMSGDLSISDAIVISETLMSI